MAPKIIIFFEPPGVFVERCFVLYLSCAPAGRLTNCMCLPDSCMQLSSEKNKIVLEPNYFSQLGTSQILLLREIWIKVVFALLFVRWVHVLSKYGGQLNDAPCVHVSSLFVAVLLLILGKFGKVIRETIAIFGLFWASFLVSAKATAYPPFDTAK